MFTWKFLFLILLILQFCSCHVDQQDKDTKCFPKNHCHFFFYTIFQILMDPTTSSSCHSVRTSFALWRRRKETLIPAFTWRSDSPTVITRPKSKTTSTNSKTICTTTFKGIASFWTRLFPCVCFLNSVLLMILCFPTNKLVPSLSLSQLSVEQPACVRHLGPVHSCFEVLLLRPQHSHLHRRRADGDPADALEKADGARKRAHCL